MKLLDSQTKDKLVIRQRKLELRYRKANRRRLRKFISGLDPIFGKPIKLPSTLSLNDEIYRNRIVNVYDKIIHQLTTGKSFTLDFSSVKEIQPAAMLLLFAHLKYVMYKNALIKVSGILPKSTNSKVSQVIKQIGLSSIILCENDSNPSDEDVIHWQVVSGREADGSKTEFILQAIEKCYGDEVVEGLYEGVTEAMINVRQHAYKSDIQIDIEGDEWWLFFQIKDGMFHISICDLGIGIPKSLNDNHYDKNKGIFQYFTHKRRDSDAIKAAIKLGKSRTKEENRGKGLPQIVYALQDVEGSKISILSGHGIYIRTDTEYQIDRDFRTPIRGTVLNWSLPLTERNE